MKLRLTYGDAAREIVAGGPEPYILDTNVFGLAVLGLVGKLREAVKKALNGRRVDETKLLETLAQKYDDALDAILILLGCGRRYQCYVTPQVVAELRRSPYPVLRKLAELITSNDTSHREALASTLVSLATDTRNKIEEEVAKWLARRGPRVKIATPRRETLLKVYHQARTMKVFGGYGKRPMVEQADPYLVALALDLNGVVVTADYDVARLAKVMGARYIFLPLYEHPARDVIEKRLRERFGKDVKI